MHAKPDLRVLLKWMIAGSGSVITDVIPLMKLKQFSLRFAFLLTAFVAIAIAVYNACPKPQIFEMPPERILHKMDRRFDDLSSNTTEEQILGQLGLGRYQNYLAMQSKMVGGIGYGGIQSEYLVGQYGYYLTITSTLDDHLIWRLKTPNFPNWRERKLFEKKNAEQCILTATRNAG